MPKFLFPLLLFSVSYVNQSRQLFRMSCHHNVCVCYMRLFHWVIPYNEWHFDVYKTIKFWAPKWIYKSCSFLANHLCWMKTFPQNCLYIWQNMYSENFVCQLQILRSIFCSIFLRRCKSLWIYYLFYGSSICCFALDISSWFFLEV